MHVMPRITDRLTLVCFDIRIWSGRKKLRAEDLQVGNGDPPRRAGLLGVQARLQSRGVAGIPPRQEGGRAGLPAGGYAVSRRICRRRRARRGRGRHARRLERRVRCRDRYVPVRVQRGPGGLDRQPAAVGGPDPPGHRAGRCRRWPDEVRLPTVVGRAGRAPRDPGRGGPSPGRRHLRRGGADGPRARRELLGQREAAPARAGDLREDPREAGLLIVRGPTHPTGGRHHRRLGRPAAPGGADRGGAVQRGLRTGHALGRRPETGPAWRGTVGGAAGAGAG